MMLENEPSSVEENIPLQYWDDWVWSLEHTHKISAVTIQKHYNPIRKLVKYAFQEFAGQWGAYFVSRLKDDVSDSTIKSRLATIKRWNKWLKTQKGLEWDRSSLEIPNGNKF